MPQIVLGPRTDEGALWISPKQSCAVRSAHNITLMRVLIAALAVSLTSSLAACSDGVAEGTCVDQTSYDYNWNNDMYCKRPDGSTFETNRERAAEFESRHSR
jgi:hypothetical protein